MEKSYTELVRKIGELYGYDSDALTAPLDDAIYRFEGTPILGPDGVEILKKSLSNDLLTRFDEGEPGWQNDPNKFQGGGWVKYLLWRKTH